MRGNFATVEYRTWKEILKRKEIEKKVEDKNQMCIRWFNRFAVLWDAEFEFYYDEMTCDVERVQMLRVY